MYGVRVLCVFFGLSRAAYYAWRKRQAGADPDQERMGWIGEAYRASFRTYGYRRIGIWLAQERDRHLNGKAILRIMQKMGIRSIARRRRPAELLANQDQCHKYPNLLERDFQASRPNQKWVTDVTYIRTAQGWAYLAVIKDLHDGFIVAYSFSRQNSVRLVTRMLQEAKRHESVGPGLILHSDQGHQYSSPGYRLLTQEYGILPSMSRRGNCWDNAPMENFFGHLKAEAVRHWGKPSFQQASQWIDEYIHFYNFERIQLKTRRTPYQLRCPSR
jgi:transposase InsO family protein